MNKRIQEIAQLSVRCRDSDGERHGVDHNCIACKPWLILKRINENEENLNDEHFEANDHEMDITNLEEEILNFYSHHSLKSKKTWLCSLCQKTIPLDIKTCICIGNGNGNNHNHSGSNPKLYQSFPFKSGYNNNRDKDKDKDKALQNALNDRSIKNKDCLMVIKELAEFLHVSIQFNQIPQEFKSTSHPFEYEICFDGSIIAKGVGNSKRKAQRDGADLGLTVLSGQGHGRTIQLLQRFGRIGHCEIDRNLFVEIERDISDQSHLYKIKGITNDSENEKMLSSRLIRQIIIDDAPEIKAYKTRVFEISQLDEPSVLGCFDGSGGNKCSLVSGIFHRDVNNGRYGYNPRYQRQRKNKDKDKDKDKEKNGNESTTEKRTKKKRKKRRNSKRKKNASTNMEKSDASTPRTTESGTNTVNDESCNDDKSVNTANTTDSTIQTQDPDVPLSEILNFNEEKQAQNPLETETEQLRDTTPENDNAAAFLLPFPTIFNVEDNPEQMLPNRRHSYGSSSGNSKNSYPHPWKNQHYYLSPHSHHKHNGKSHRRRKRHSAMKSNPLPISAANVPHGINGIIVGLASDVIEKEKKENEIVDEQLILQHDDVYVCADCKTYFPNAFNGEYLDEHIPKWYCSQCIDKQKKSHMNVSYTKRKNIHDAQHKPEKEVTPPCTPPSSDDDGSGDIHHLKHIQNPKLQQRHHGYHHHHRHRHFPTKRKSPNKRKRSNHSHNQSHNGSQKKKHFHHHDRNKHRQSPHKKSKSKKPKSKPKLPKAHTTMSSVPISASRSRCASPEIPSILPIQLTKSRSVESEVSVKHTPKIPKSKGKSKKKSKRKAPRFQSESPELVIRDIMETEMSDITFSGPKTPSSPSLTDREFASRFDQIKEKTENKQKHSKSGHDASANPETENDNDSNSDSNDNAEIISTVSIATQVQVPRARNRDKLIADKAIQCIAENAPTKKIKVTYPPRNVVRIDTNSSRSSRNHTPTSEPTTSNPTTPDSDDEEDHEYENKTENDEDQNDKLINYHRNKARHNRFRNKFKDKHHAKHNEHHEHHEYHEHMGIDAAHHLQHQYYQHQMMYNPYHQQMFQQGNGWNTTTYYHHRNGHHGHHHHGHQMNHHEMYMMNGSYHHSVHSHQHNHNRNDHHNSRHNHQQNRGSITTNGYETFQCSSTYHHM